MIKKKSVNDENTQLKDDLEVQTEELQEQEKETIKESKNEKSKSKKSTGAKKSSKTVKKESTVSEEKIKTVSTPKTKSILISDIKTQLDIYVKKTIIVTGNLVKVFNEGYGDVYVGENEVTMTPETLIRHGEDKEFSNVSTLTLISASRPVARIKQYR